MTAPLGIKTRKTTNIQLLFDVQWFKDAVKSRTGWKTSPRRDTVGMAKSCPSLGHRQMKQDLLVGGSGLGEDISERLLGFAGLLVNASRRPG